MSSAQEDIEVVVRERILSPLPEVFDAVVDPGKMSNYFISRASGPMAPGPVTWWFGDVGARVEITVVEAEANRRIIWESTALGQPTRSLFEFAPDGEDATVVIVREGKFPFTPDGVKLALGQTAGWTYTLCGLKAFVQFGINLRTGLNRRLTDV